MNLWSHRHTAVTMKILLLLRIASALQTLVQPTKNPARERLEASSIEALGGHTVISLIQEKCGSRIGASKVSEAPWLVASSQDAVQYGAVEEAYDRNLRGLDSRLDIDDDDVRLALVKRANALDALEELVESLDDSSMLFTELRNLEDARANELQRAFLWHLGQRTTDLANTPELREARDRAKMAEQALGSAVADYYPTTKKTTFFELERHRHVVAVDRSVLSQEKNGGTVRGRSRSGKTVYVEPKHLSSMADAIDKAYQDIERIEAERIAELQRQAQQGDGPLRECLDAAGKIDSLRARGRVGFDTFCGVVPSVRDDGEILAKAARHPLLAKEAQPCDLSVGPGRGVLVCGPNGAGKTCLLATVGLLALLTRMAVPVPASEAQISVYSRIFADLDLSSKHAFPEASTYEAHLSFVATALSGGATERSQLVLLDELGSGTDFHEGGALAVAALEALVQRSAVAAATHHPAVKSLGIDAPDVYQIYAYALDPRTKIPNFKVAIGTLEPTTANALDAAERRGVPGSVIRRAAQRLGGKSSESSSSEPSSEWRRRLEVARERAENAIARADAERAQFEAERTRARETLRAATEDARHRALKAADRLEAREAKLDALFKELRDTDLAPDAIVGETIAAARAVRKEADKDRRATILAANGLIDLDVAPAVGDDLVLLAFDMRGTLSTCSGTVVKVDPALRRADLQLDQRTTLSGLPWHDLAKWYSPVFADDDSYTPLRS